MNNAGDKPVVTQEEDIFAFIRECVETARSDCEGYHLSNKPGEPDLSRYDAAMTWIARFEQDTLSREGREASILWERNVLATIIVELLNMVPRVRRGAGDMIVRRARQAIDGLPDAIAQGEENYRAYRLALRETEKPDGTLESLATVATMLEEFGVKELPANEQGQVDFMRAIMESAVDEIRGFLANQAALSPPASEGRDVGREAEPVAWLYEHPGHPKGRAPNEVVFNRHIGPLGEGWTETPLYAVAPETTDAFEQVGFYKEKLAQAEQEIEDCKAYLPKYQEALRLGRAYRDAVIGWREYDWPAGFCRRTAEMIAENAERVAGSVALPTSPEQADQADVLRERIAELEAALRFYADAEKWDDFAADQQASVFDRNFGSELGGDRGALARATLSNIGSSNDG